jgi:Cu+-exporting ATPase
MSTVEMEVGRMTCAACATRVEKRPNRMPGVKASVNFALERASVDFPSGTSVADLVRTVDATGYTASPVKLQPAQAPLSPLS